MFNPRGASRTKGQTVHHHVKNKRLVTDIPVQDSHDEDLDLNDVAEFSDTIYTEQPSGLDEFYVDSVDFSRKMTVDDWCEHGKVNNQNIVFKLDSGAQVNVTPERSVDVNACHMTKPRTALILKIWIKLSDVSTTPWLLWKTSQRECRKRKFFQGSMLRVAIGK